MKISIIPFIACIALISGGMQGSLFSQENISGDTADGYELSLQSLFNMEVTTASKSPEKQSDAPGIISVITKDELNRFGGTTFKDVLERVPSLISAVGGYTQRSSIIIRGDFIKQTSSHILILLNGRPVREIQEGGLSADIVNSFPVNIIERIEVIKGPGSVLYGSDAFSGVINIITANPDKNKVSLTGLYQGGGGFKSAGEGFAKVGDLNIVVAGQYYEKSVWELPTYSKKFASIPTPPFFMLVDTLITVDLPDKGPGLFMGVTYKGLRVNATYDEWATNNMITVDEVKNTKYFANAGYSQKINDNWNMDFNFTYCQAKFLGHDYFKRNSYNIVGEWTNFVKFGDKANLAVGGLFNRIDGKETFIKNPDSIYDICDGKQSAYASYAQIDYQLIKSLKLIAGAQLNKVGHLDISFVPRVGLIFYPISMISIKALYSEAYRAPSINELYLNNELMIGNKNLKPEKVSTFDFGISYQGEKAQVGISAFYSKQKDNIQPAYYNGMARQYINIGEATFMGGEFEGKYYLNRNIYFNASMLYQKNKNDSTKNLVPLANLGAKAGISYQWGKGITVSLFDIYQGDIDNKYNEGLNPDPGAYNLLHFHSELRLNTLFNMFKGPGISLLFNIDNILDKEVFLYDWGGVSNSSVPGFPGRAIYIGLKIDLE